MGSQQQFCLRWNNHQVNMLGVFDQLLQTEALVDVTIACEGLSLKAHKVVLSACSPFFQSLFLENPCKHPIVILKDVKYSDLKALVDFMYRGEVNVSQEHLSALLQTAETLKVKGLAEVTGGMGDHAGGDANGRGAKNMVSQPQQEDLPSSLAAQPLLDDAKHSPPSKRKKVRSRRRSGGSSNHSDREDDDAMQIPAEVVEAKVEIVDDDDEQLQHEQTLDSIPTSIGQTFQHGEASANIPSGPAAQKSESDMPVNRSFGSSTVMEVLPCPSTSNATTSALNRTVHLPPPLIPAQTSVPVLSVPSLPSTSGSQPSSQDHMAAFRFVKRRRAFPIRGNESIRMAVEAVINYNISFREAARRFGVNHSTVYNHVKFARMRQAKIFEKSNMVKLEQ